MSLLIIIILTGLITILIGLLGVLFYMTACSDFGEKITLVITVVLIVVALIFIPFGCMYGATIEETEYITNYEAQKEVIEGSLQSEILTGYERAALVNKAAELNGELAERKVVFDRWYNLYLDETLYDNVEPINLDISKEEN